MNTAVDGNVKAAIFSYCAIALALHVSNILATHDPAFDVHQLISDEVSATSLALAVLGVARKKLQRLFRLGPENPIHRFSAFDHDRAYLLPVD
jgi:hypothetical protein